MLSRIPYFTMTDRGMVGMNQGKNLFNQLFSIRNCSAKYDGSSCLLIKHKIF